MKELLRRYLTDEQITEFMRDLAHQRRRVEGTCEVCGATIEGTTRRRYCGTSCKQRAYRGRRADTASPASARRQRPGYGVD